MERFKIIQPSAALIPYIRHYWLLESDDTATTQRIIPTGNIELVFHRGSQMIQNGKTIPRTTVSGQTLSFSDLVPTGTVNMIAVVFHSFGAKAFFDIPIYKFSNLTLSADDLNIKPLKELEDKILDTKDDNISIRLIESFLISRLKPLREYNYNRIVTAVNTINLCNEEVSVSNLAATVCLSSKQFRRIFNEHIGVTPKEFMRIIRFHKALFILQNDPTTTLTSLAYECGYYDQAHMITEFKLFSGYTPREYISICAPYSDYFSI